MPPKKAQSTKFLIRAKAEGQWTQGEGQSGEFRVSVDTDLAQVVINAGPDYLEEWNPVPLKSYSMRYLRGGSHLRIAFELLPLQWKGELELNVFGGVAGKFDGPGGPGKVTGTGVVEEERDYQNEVPRPTKELAEKMAKEPRNVKWEAPQCLSEGKVLLVGIGGPSKSGKSVLAAAMAATLEAQNRQVAVVDQSRYEFCVGSFNCSAGVNEPMYENPAAIIWADLAKALSKALAAVEGTAEAPGIVILEGSLVFHMPQFCQAMHRRLYLRTSRAEVLRRRQASATLAEPFVEHIFWPHHLQFGLPQAPWDDIRVVDGEEGHPAPEALVSEALGALGLGASGAAAAEAPKAQPEASPAAAEPAAAE